MARPLLPHDSPLPNDPGAAFSLPTKRGPIDCRYHRVRAGEGAVILLGGTDGGLQGPADWIYPTIAEDLDALGIGTLRLDFRVRRVPGDLEEAVFDVLAAASFLDGEGAGPIAVAGHSFGGAVAIEAGARNPLIQTVVGLSSQSLGAENAGKLAPRPLLLVHGAADDRLSPLNARLIYSWAREPKELVLLPRAKHSLRQRRPELRELLVRWLSDALAGRSSP